MCACAHSELLVWWQPGVVDGGAIDFDVPDAAEFCQGMVVRVAVHIEAYEALEVLHELVETSAA